MSSLKARKASPTSVPSSIDWRNMAASEHFGSHDLQVGAEMAVLPPDLATDTFQGTFEAKPGVDTYDQQIEHVGKRDPISQMQLPYAARDVSIGPHHPEEDGDSRQAELQVPGAIAHELFGEEDGDRQNDDGRYACKDVVLDGVSPKKARAYQFTSQLRAHRAFHAETLLIENCRDERIKP